MTRRQMVTLVVPLVGAAFAGLGAAVLLVAGELRWGAALSTALITGSALLLIDLRRRAAGLAHLLALSAERQREMTSVLVAIMGPDAADPDAPSVQGSLLGRLEATERRLLDAIAAADLGRGAMDGLGSERPSVSETSRSHER